MTTADCLDGARFFGTDFVVQYGSNNLLKMYDEKMYVQVEKSFPHPNHVPFNPYDPRTGSDNIALIKLATPLDFSDNVQPACLPNASFVDYRDYMKIVGFGMNVSATVFFNGTTTIENLDSQTNLKEAEVLDNTRTSRLCKGIMPQNICVRAADRKNSSAGTRKWDFRTFLTLWLLLTW